MGIPSFYKRLITIHKSIVTKHLPTNVKGLYLDFNCLIYHCVRRPGMPPYDPLNHLGWEKTLLDEITKYVVQLWTEGGKPQEMFLAIDGVVPLAKIKQQRLRRFKSAWLSEEEKKLGIRSGVSWDTNCITPGTEFMERLGNTMRQLCLKRGNGWSVSDASEPGEGEQKIMKKLRQTKTETSKPYVIYGLDADLILLSLLNGYAQGKTIYLMREDTEFGQTKTDTTKTKEESYSFLSVDVLARSLWSDFDTLSRDEQTKRIQTYVGAMSLLGNDFLPHSLSIKVKEDGHERLAKDLVELDVPFFLTNENENGYQRINPQALLSLFSRWEKDEEELILHSFKKKMQMKGRMNYSDPVTVLSNRPLEWQVEREVLKITKTQEEKTNWTLVTNWRDIYHDVWMVGYDSQKACQEYVYGVQWVYDYYTGQKEVDLFWMYPVNLPPLWLDLTKHNYININTNQDKKHKRGPLAPQEQLALVLPKSSWHFIRDKKLRELPFLYPQFWPSAFSFFSVGRRMLWECEASIPFFPIERLPCILIPSK